MRPSASADLYLGLISGPARHRRRARRVAEAPCIRVRSRARCLRRHAAPAFCLRSDRDCSSWMEDYDIPGVAGLDLPFLSGHGVARRGIGGKAGGALAPRCVKDVIEEKLFDRRRDLFTDLSAVFMDTTSLSFYGEGGETLGGQVDYEGLSARSRPDDPRSRGGQDRARPSAPRCGRAIRPT